MIGNCLSWVMQNVGCCLQALMYQVAPAPFLYMPQLVRSWSRIINQRGFITCGSVTYHVNTLNAKGVLHWRHVSFMASPITSGSTYRLIRHNNKENITALLYWPFRRGTHRSPVDSPHKGPVIRKELPCLGVIIIVRHTAHTIVS